MRAIASNEELVRVVGLETDKLIRAGLIASSITVAVAGVLKGYDTGLAPMMGFEVLFAAVVAVVIGGGDAPLEVGAAISLGVIQQFAVWVVPTQWQNVIVFLILIIFLLAKPQAANNMRAVRPPL
jgi:branched-subunit amino acid ABC-type transport system permease component